MNIANRRLTKPVYKRQQFLLTFLKELNEPLAAIDFQKLLFLYLIVGVFYPPVDRQGRLF